MPNTGMSSGRMPNASRLRTSWRPTSRSASLAPRRSNLLIATTSAKSSMSIFSSCEAAPNSGVITYSEVSTNGTIAASPWPMPGVSTITRSNPAALTTSITSGRCSGSSRLPRVARLRKKTRSPSREFIRIRSPSSAPPPRRRVGSTAITAIRSLSCWSTRNRRTSSSVSEDLPEPPVPVMPRTGVTRAAAAARSWARKSLGSLPEFGAGDGAGDREPVSREYGGGVGRLAVPQVEVAVPHDRVDHPGQAHPLTVLRGEDRHPARRAAGRSPRAR